MKQLLLITLITVYFLQSSFSQSPEPAIENATEIIIEDVPAVSSEKDKRINFYVIAKYEKSDLNLMFVKLRAFFRGIFSRKLYIIHASSSEDAATKIERIAHRRRRLIGTLWFDSHGHYGKGHSLFDIGRDEFNYKTIRDPVHTKHLVKIARYCDRETKIGVGSCYGGATFTFPAIQNFPERRMNGDSLLMGVANIFSGASVYGSESFVMNRLGMWANSYAFAGYPLDKDFNDTLYKPVWEHLGMWNKYSTATKMIEPVNTVRLNRRGDLSTTNAAYLSHRQCKINQERKLRNLKGGYFDMKNLSQ